MEDLMIQNILESMTDSLMVIGPKGEMVYANTATEDILGCDLHALKRNGLGVTFFTREDNYEFNQIIVDAIHQKAVRSYSEVTYRHPDGSARRIAATTSYLVDPTKPDYSFVGFMAIFKDITEVYELRQREKRLLEERQRVASEKAQGLQKLAAGVAHEIRNPTVTVGGFAARLLRLKELPEAAVECARNIMDGAKRLESLVEEVQSYCDITRADLVEWDLVDIVQKPIQALSETAERRNVDLRFRNESSEISSCYCDPSLLKKAMLHLLENAIDFSAEGGVVETVLSAGTEDFFIEVIDFGEGIADEDFDHIFNPFFSTRPDKAGMGLATVQRIVTEHMGTITVESKPHGGTRVRVSLPRNRHPGMEGSAHTNALSRV
jgi:PAS domain S-box-containing protein